MPDDILAEARTWIGTPWNPHGHLRGVGANCIAMHLTIAQMLGITIEDFPDEHAQILRAPDWSLHTKREYFVEAFTYSGHLREVPPDTMQPGDVLLFAFGRNPCSHAGILTRSAPQAAMIHIDFRRHIAEEPLAPWRSRLRVVLRLDYARLELEEIICR
jgi:cell wall-associated NlpC family hydrolase